MGSLSRKAGYTVLVTVLIHILFSGCSNPVMEGVQINTNMASSGTLEINLSISESDRSVIPADYKESVERYEILLTGTQGMGPVTITDPTVFLEDLPLGDYTIAVTALDSGSKILAVGSVSDVAVAAGLTASVSVELLPVMGGEGTAVIEYDWSDAGFPAGRIDEVIAVLTPVGGSPISIDAVVGDSGLEYTGTFPSGEYVLTCELYDGEVLVSSIAETIQIFDGLETRSELTLGPESFNTVPFPPSAPRTVQSGLSAGLSWIDSSDLETGYRIYRSDDGGDFKLVGSGLPANSVSWTDTPIVPGTEYLYRIVALNAFGESESQDVLLVAAPAILEPEDSESRIVGVVIGDSDNTISVSQLIDGYSNMFNRSDLEILSVSIDGNASARLDNGDVVIDTSSLPYEREGGEIVLEYTVHIVGEPINGTFSTTGSIRLLLTAPEVEKIVEEDLLAPVQGFVYDNRTDMQRKMRLYEPPNPQEIFDNWGRLSNHMYFSNGSDAESSVESRGDEADMAQLWKLKADSGGSYVEYSKNSVYAGFVSPDGEESQNFTLEATVSSKDDDDDTVGLIIAFFNDGRSNYVLEAARSQGSASGDKYVEPREGWGLLVRRLSEGDEHPEIGEVLWSRQLNVGGLKSDGWKGAGTRIKADRSGDIVTISTTDWNDEENYVQGSVISVDLRTDRALSLFLGPQKYGYFTASQERTSFRDIVMNGGVIQDKLFYLNTETGESEVWWYDNNSGRWIRMAGADIQGVLGYPLEITNPETGETYLIERKGFRRGRWQDWWDRWSQWDRYDRGRSGRD